MSQPRKRSAKVVEKKLSLHDRLAEEIRKIASYEEIKNRFNTEEPFASNLTDPWAFKRWVTVTMNLLHNVFSHTRAYKEETGKGHTGFWIDKREFFDWLRKETSVHRKFSPQNAYDWVFRRILSMARRHTVWNMVSVHGYSLDFEEMTQDEWTTNMQTIADAFDPECKHKDLNVFVCQQENAQQCFISSRTVGRDVQERIEDDQENEFQVRLLIGGGEYDFYINNPHLCGFPFAERNYGPVEELEMRFLPSGYSD